jgi:hypothetical protein
MSYLNAQSLDIYLLYQLDILGMALTYPPSSKINLYEFNRNTPPSPSAPFPPFADALLPSSVSAPKPLDRHRQIAPPNVCIRKNTAFCWDLTKMLP